MKKLNILFGLSILVAGLETWEVVFENANFFKWFPPGEDADEPFTNRVPKFKPDRAISRTGDSQSFGELK